MYRLPQQPLRPPRPSFGLLAVRQTMKGGDWEAEGRGPGGKRVFFLNKKNLPRKE